MAITTTSVARYTVLPGVLPRLKDLFGSGFAFLASVIAVLYFNMGLLPQGHPYLDSKNHGRFGIRHVVAEAGKNLVYSRKNIDQIILYFTILIGLVILALQFVLLVTSLIAEPVFAGNNWFDFYAVNWTSYFTSSTIPPSQDIAFVVLDKVFGAMQRSGTGLPGGFFGSCVSDLGTPCTDIRGNNIYSPAAFPTPFHIALHQMLEFYTLGIGFISGLIIIYFVVAIIGETATSGTPFGRRFNKGWFVPRLIVFFALLAPITVGGGNNDGLNVAQLITLSVAKYGSNMATNGWLGFVSQIGFSGPSVCGAILCFGDFVGKGSSAQFGQFMLSVPNVPELASLAQFMYIVRTCMYAEGIINGINVYPYVVRPTSTDTTSVNLINRNPPATENYNNMGGTTADWIDYYSGADPIAFWEAVEFSRYNDVILRFGHRNPPGTDPLNPLDNPPGAYDDEWGNVEPTCGEIKFELSSLDPFVIGPAPNGPAEYAVQEVYWLFLDNFLFWDDVYNDVPLCMLQAMIPYDHDTTCLRTPVPGTPGVIPPGNFNTIGPGAPAGSNFNFAPTTNNTSWLTVGMARSQMELTNAINKAIMMGQRMTWNSSSRLGFLAGSVDVNFLNYYDDINYINSLIFSNELRERGWAGAALWYNKLAEINGIYGSAVQNIPRPYKYPKVMEQVAAQHAVVDKNAAHSGRFNPRLGNGELANLPRPGDQYIAAALYSTYEFWNSAAVQETTFTRSSNNAIIDAINMIFGTHGIFDIVENSSTYPLALLSGLGKSMVDASLRNLFVGVVGQGVGGALDDFPGKSLVQVGGSFMFRMGMIGMGIGFVLYYVLPIMPFIYFLFAFGGWIKSVFEAVLAMPLWALAHIKIDGEGLPGPWATNGYFLLFEIFLRPTLIIFGFIFSISMYAALVDTLHNSYHLLTFVSSGFDIEAEVNLGNVAGPPPGRDVSIMSTFNPNNAMAFMRGPLDELFYSIIYVILVYMIGVSTFKLVDLIPNNIMRWMGVTVSTWHETAGDPASELAGKMYRSVNMTNAQIRGMMDRNSNAAADQLLQNQLSR